MACPLIGGFVVLDGHSFEVKETGKETTLLSLAMISGTKFDIM